LLRKESRGLHFTLDYQQTNDESATPTILVPEARESENPQKISLISP